ncbi:metalloregulator ArsR/SmtB family transcription factor [Paenibacillus pasadenensis]|uniref:ArsR/SmtB family transcription factor n=1 Tax=Paenibacillus pasadenensis TaxID=217090 RepID=UPI00203A721E|nr:metalloregulator ArsR/SmtB family transcription factor [Paenibacillus pasadenensis]MCM3746769.1 metalloregulator ArsR/SmtB family transcription factor [Paenibacillus pasadenensis]
MDDNEVFKALADPSRRLLLDLLNRSDGRTLNELCAHLQMTRFGVMKHLNVLEEAGLITTRKAGREKLHYLNAVPIRQIYERWVSQYAEPWAIGLTSLKQELESADVMENKPKNVNRIAIKAAPEQVWAALTDPAKTSKFWFNCSILSSWEKNSPFELTDQQGVKKVEGTLLEIDPPGRLVMSWKFLMPDTAGDQLSRVTWEITPHAEMQGVTLVTVVHDDFEQAPAAEKVLLNGIPIVLSGMKTFLETGSSLSGV